VTLLLAKVVATVVVFGVHLLRNFDVDFGAYFDTNGQM
jgi:hypothetical protein